MMQVYYSWVGWISGIAFFVAFALTFWPSRRNIQTAAILWGIGALAIAGLTSYDFFLRAAIGQTFDPRGRSALPFVNWLIPLLSLGLAVGQSALLFSWVSQERALRIGRVLFLIIVPAFVLLRTLPEWRSVWGFPLGREWLGMALLWFRIRERHQ